MVQIYVHDTVPSPYPVYVYVHDTIPAPYPIYVHDTVPAPYPIYVHDTTYITEYITDTLWLSLHDTVYIHDTIYIYDTLATSSNQVESISAKIYGNNGQIIVEGANGKGVTLYSASGQLVATKQDDYSEVCFDAPASGVYLVKIGDFAPRKIVIKK